MVSLALLSAHLSQASARKAPSICTAVPLSASLPSLLHYSSCASICVFSESPALVFPDAGIEGRARPDCRGTHACTHTFTRADTNECARTHTHTAPECMRMGDTGRYRSGSGGTRPDCWPASRHAPLTSPYSAYTAGPRDDPLPPCGDQTEIHLSRPLTAMSRPSSAATYHVPLLPSRGLLCPFA
jgi:hypothetical protein